jgi:putative ABC transport system permease protein
MVLVAIAVYMFTAIGAAADALAQGEKVYYREQRMADVFAKVSALPRAMASSLTQIPGVDEALLRLTYDGRVLMAGHEKTIWLRLISYDASYPGKPLNAPVVQGNPLSGAYDIWPSQGFLDIHGLKIGDSLTVAVKGREVDFNIAGGANAPDFAYAVRDATELYPDHEAFGVAFVGERTLNLLLDSRDMYNDLAFSLQNGWTFEDVKSPLQEALAPYGLMELVARKDQFSAAMLKMEINSIKSMSVAMPVLFALMAAVVLTLMMKRVIEQERTQIGTLKAFGYTNFEILSHYMLYGLVTGAVGGAVGLLLGAASVGALMDMYTQFFTLPGVSRSLAPGLAVQAMALAAGAGMLGAYGGARPALALAPAEAMRPPAPPPVKSDILKKLPFLWAVLSSRGGMGLRNISRAKLRSVFIVLGITFSFSMIAMMWPMMDLMSDMMSVKYTRIQTYDAKLTLRAPQDRGRAQRDALGLPGVFAAETLREIPAELRRGHLKAGTILYGLRPGQHLYRLYDETSRAVRPLPASGLVLTKSAAEDLNVVAGQTLWVTTPYNEDEIPLLVSGVVTQNMVPAAYMDAEALNAMLNLPDQAESLMVRTQDMEGLKAKLDTLDNVAGFEETKSAMLNFSQMMSSYESLLYVMALLGIVVAFAIIYNSSTISLSEKQREYATLRVLGMRVGEVGEIHGFEYWTLFILGSLLGIPFTKLLMVAMNEMVKNMLEAFEMPTDVKLSGLIAGFVGCTAAVLLSNLSTRGKLKKLDLVDVLKERE